MKLIRRKDLNIEDIRTEDYWNRFRIFSILNNESFEKKFEIPSLVQSCLNSRESTLNILKAFTSHKLREFDFEKNMGLNIRTYIIENLPIYTYIKILNNFTESFIQLRNHRYIERDTTFFLRIPKEIAKPREIRRMYEEIQFESIANYREVFSLQKQNHRKYAHLFLPLGIQNRGLFSFNMSENIQLVNSLLCSDMVVENQLGEMFETIIKPEIKITPECEQRTAILQIIQYLRDLVSVDQQFKGEEIGDFKFQYVDDIVENIITNFEQLINPLGSKKELEFDYNDQIYIGKLIRKVYMGNIIKSKGGILTGYIPISELIKLLEYKYTIYVPLLSDFIDIDKELDRPNERCFLLPTDITDNGESRREFYKRLAKVYGEIKKWRAESKKYMSEEMSKEYTKYLLPICHVTRFNLYLDVNDIFDLRRKDFEYKEQWMKLFYQKDPLFKK